MDVTAFTIALALAGAGAACSDDVSVDSCDDALSGVWRASVGAAPEGGPRRYHLVDRGPHLEVFPMFDDTARGGGSKRHAPVTYTPGVFDFERASPRGDAPLRGTLRYRATRGAVTCPVTRDAVIRQCRDDRLRVAVRDATEPRWPGCAIEHGDMRERIWAKE